MSAMKCLAAAQGCFAGVIGADAMGDAAKPEPSAFATALEVIGAAHARQLAILMHPVDIKRHL